MRLAIGYGFVLFSTFWISTVRAEGPRVQDLKAQVNQVLATVQEKYAQRLNNPLASAPELGGLVTQLRKEIESNPEYTALAEKDRGFRAHRTQVLNHLQHVSYEFEMGHPQYSHDFVLKDPYPVIPTLQALQKAADFIDVATPGNLPAVERVAPDPEREKVLQRSQNELAKAMTKDSLPMYREMRSRLEANRNAPFKKEFGPLVEYLELKIKSDEGIIDQATDNPYLRKMRQIALTTLEKVKNGDCPYLDTINAVERALEFYDVYYRAIDPNRSPVLYHSGRYEYYIHYLKSTAPEHIMMPSLAYLGATDLLRIRGVPISFIGVNADIAWVDGFYQTPFEFYVHDINHSRRMYQFFSELAKEEGKSIDQLAQESDEFVKNKLMPLISIKPDDSKDVANHKRTIKILMFEVLHEDALPALKSVLEKAVQREEGQITPFERIDHGNKVVYVMEPGATTLRYVYRKLSGDFYDRPGVRSDNVVAPYYRTEANIVKAAQALFAALGLSEKSAGKFAHLVSTDEGLPADYAATIERDNLRRPKETKPLIDSARVREIALRELKRDPNFTRTLDPSRDLQIEEFTMDGHRLKVRLLLPVKGEPPTIDFRIDVPEEHFGVNQASGTINQIKGAHNVVPVHSGTHFNITTFTREVLTQMAGGNYLVTVRGDDPKANEIIQAAKRLGVKTLLLVDANNSRGTTTIAPSYFVVVENPAELIESWKKFSGKGPGYPPLNFDFRQTPAKSARDTFSAHDSRQFRKRRLIEQKIRSKQKIATATLGELQEGIGKNKTPLLMVGASIGSWPNVSPQNQNKVRDAIHRALDALDPGQTYIITSGMDVGVEKIVHEAAEARGIIVVATMAETGTVEDLSSNLSRVAVVSADWGGKARHALEFIQRNGGSCVFFGGAKTMEEEINMARQMGVRFFAMRGPEGAAHEISNAVPRAAFENGDELTAHLFEHHPKIVRHEYQRTSRDALYRRVASTLAKQGIEEVSYRQLVEKAKGRKVVILGGFVGLGYEHPDKVRAAVKELMAREGDGVMYVGVGTYQGIGVTNDWIPEFAKAMGFKDIKTAGIVSRNVAKLPIAKQDYIHFVDGDVTDWNNVVDGTYVDVRFAQDTKGRHVFFSGGEISGKVARQALALGLTVEVHQGEDFAPSQQDLLDRRRTRPGTIENGFVELVSQNGKFPSLTVKRGPCDFDRLSPAS